MSVSKMEQLTRRSQFIFRGTIAKLASSTLTGLVADEQTAIVKVDEVFHRPLDLDDFTGREITVRLSSPKDAEPGQERVFFTTSWLYGESIAVTDVGWIGGADMPAVKEGIAQVTDRMQDDELQGRLARASLVVAGKVIATRQLKSDRRQPITEHAPDWWQAEIAVESVEKGRWAKKQLAILFPSSTDELWIASPKFERGQAGIWILRRNQKERGWPAMREPGLTALDPLDFQPLSERSRIRRLLGEQG